MLVHSNFAEYHMFLVYVIEYFSYLEAVNEMSLVSVCNLLRNAFYQYKYGILPHHGHSAQETAVMCLTHLISRKGETDSCTRSMPRPLNGKQQLLTLQIW